MFSTAFLGMSPSYPARILKAFKPEGGTTAAYLPVWHRDADCLAWAASFLRIWEPVAPEVVMPVTEMLSCEDAWVELRALYAVFRCNGSVLDHASWDPVSLMTLFDLPEKPVNADCDSESDTDSDDSIIEPVTPVKDRVAPVSLDVLEGQPQTPLPPATIFIDGEFITVASAEDRQLAFKQRVLARAGLPSPASRAATPGADSPSKVLSAAARPFTPSAQTVAYASYMHRNPGDAKCVAKLFEMRMRVQACAG